MPQIVTFAIGRVLKDRKGVSATEYTLMVVGIAAAVLAGATILGTDISTALGSIGTYLTGAAAGI
jgi:Flp pilus assembly pilin Flp